MDPFLVGVRWGERFHQQFRGPKCITQFLEWILQDSEACPDTMYFAHNGGGFDHLFALYEMIEVQRGRFKVMPVLSGGSAIMVLVTEKSTGRRFALFDSLRLLNMSLKKIGVAMGGAEKQDFDIRTDPSDPRWLEYNNQDTLVLYQAITKLQDAVKDLGGEMRATAASTAMDLFRRQFLKQPLEPYHDHHEFYRECYYGGRVEIFDMNRRTDVKLFDINSLYPHACTFPLPVKIFDNDWTEETLFEHFEDPNYGVFAECLVRVPDYCNIPPLPVRREGKLIFPVGQFWGHWASPDLRNLLLVGGTIEQVKRSHRFRCEPIAKEMMETLYRARLDKERPEMGLGAKLVMNAWYGKTGQKEERDSFVFYPSKEDLNEEWTWDCKDPDHDMWVSYYKKYESHILPHIAAFVTATARSIHYPYLLQTQDPIYCDTDCLATSSAVSTGTELGAMKLEANFDWFQAYLPKLYHGKVKGIETIINRAKGFGGWNKETFEKGIVDHLSKGGAVNVKGPMKIKSLLKGGDIKPREKSSMKQIRSEYDKRVVLPDGTTKPHRLWET
jgi:hypothetical protein